MNRRQTIYFFIIFFFLLAVITIPLWFDSAMPYFWHYSGAAMEIVMRWIAELKGIVGK